MGLKNFSNWELVSFSLGITLRLENDKNLTIEERKELEKDKQKLHEELNRRKKAVN